MCLHDKQSSSKPLGSIRSGCRGFFFIRFFVMEAEIGSLWKLDQSNLVWLKFSLHCLCLLWCESNLGAISRFFSCISKLKSTYNRHVNPDVRPESNLNSQVRSWRRKNTLEWINIGSHIKGRIQVNISNCYWCLTIWKCSDFPCVVYDFNADSVDKPFGQTVESKNQLASYWVIKKENSVSVLLWGK